MGTPVMEATQEAIEVNPTFIALDSPQEEVIEDGGNADESVAEAKDEQVTTPDDVQAQYTQVDENLQLRQMLRDQKLELELLKGTVARHEAVQNSELGEEIPLSDIEQLQADIAEIGDIRSAEITQLLEVMELNPKYEDVRAVCTRSNLDTILDEAAVTVAKAQGISEAAATLLLEREVWSQPNPYKYMYGLIKEYHPSYAAGQAVEQQKQKPAPKVTETAVSLAGIAGGDSGVASGWTSSKIDAMPEMELSKVPPDVYEKYLQGTLA